MKVNVYIGSVDSVTSHMCESQDIAEQLSFLATYDHEGSTVSIVIEADSLEVYDILEAISQYQKLEKIIEQNK